MNIMKTAACVFLLLVGEALAAQTFGKKDLMTPMRDGVKLHTVVFTPADMAGPLPILFIRTPYGAPADERTILRQYAELANDGYIFAFQDIRGRFTSEGEFVMQRPLRDRGDAKAVDEATDAYDSIAWMLTHVAGAAGLRRWRCWTPTPRCGPHPNRHRRPTCSSVTTFITTERSA